jgi:hypothetical protein
VNMESEGNGTLFTHEDAYILAYFASKWSFNWIDTQEMTSVYTRPNNSNGKAIPFYRCGGMDKWKLCFTQNHTKALCDMFMRSWAILRSNGPIIKSMDNFGVKVCNYKFNNLFIGVWCVIECEHFLTHSHIIYNYCPLWWLVTDGVWILLTLYI